MIRLYSFYSRISLLLLLTLSLSACSHDYFFVPEVSGPGVIHVARGVIYPVPPSDPQFKVKVISQGLSGKNILQVRMYFLRTGIAPATTATGVSDKAPTASSAASATEYLDPQELFVTVGDEDTQIRPSQFHARPQVARHIPLAAVPKQSIEMFFPLAQLSDKKLQLTTFTFHWKVHFGAQRIETLATRFDRKDSVPPREHSADDLMFPFDDWTNPGAEWFPEGWLWY